MKRMTYATLMKKCNEGYAEVEAWSGDYAMVRFYKANGTSVRMTVEVTKIPAEVQQ